MLQYVSSNLAMIFIYLFYFFKIRLYWEPKDHSEPWNVCLLVCLFLQPGYFSNPSTVYSRSGLLEQGVDRIVAQVVDPKVQHTFRPQVERVVRQFLSPGNHVEEEEPPHTLLQMVENQEAQLPSPGVRACEVLKTVFSFFNSFLHFLYKHSDSTFFPFSLFLELLFFSCRLFLTPVSFSHSSFPTF